MHEDGVQIQHWISNSPKPGHDMSYLPLATCYHCNPPQSYHDSMSDISFPCTLSHSILRRKKVKVCISAYDCFKNYSQWLECSSWKRAPLALPTYYTCMYAAGHAAASCALPSSASNKARVELLSRVFFHAPVQNPCAVHTLVCIALLLRIKGATCGTIFTTVQVGSLKDMLRVRVHYTYV